MNSPKYDVLPTSYGGRGAYAREAIPEGSPILRCTAPYAAVIFWKFRREVCATCYAYAFESGKSKWSVKLAGDKGQGGVWFCSKECRDIYVKNNEIVKGQGAGWRLEIIGALERLVAQMARVETQMNAHKAGPKNGVSNSLAFLRNIEPSDITPELIDHAWALAEELSTEECRKRAPWTDVLTEFELDTAQFVLDGLVRRAVQNVTGRTPETFSVDAEALSGEEVYHLGVGTWSDFMQLQDSELPLTKSKPYLLASRILVYRFLKYLLATLPSQAKSTKTETPRRGPPVLTDILSKSLATSTHARAIMARDYGNVFGIWDNAKQEEGSEMLGWGAYTFGSYFNHVFQDCAPNLKKTREGRGIRFYTLRDVSPGEELCISYIDEESLSVKERRDHLERDWFFVCNCVRCLTESKTNRDI
ncbi:hypothetical protein CVT26_015195 [Gymnopilus dilepis]|uniref:SET domain-containing protein n=1 Tax=Gymnopilus dilepis TaxID=231916 RepID=A0A409WS20_9AGAR|nr:hypothetical protein CVT26_015195 [Gymnopilus dilepis]